VRNLVETTLHRRYHIERELGQGGMGTVYLAQDLRLERPVAIKVLPPELAVRPELRERFLRETRTAAAFSHPNIVPVHAVEEHPQLLCFVMGFIEGETLGGRVRRGGPLGASEAVRVLQEVAWALSYAHGRGVVHRDIKPDNILIERATGRALVTDFGIARSSAASTSNLTQVGEVVGTPQYMSPEQAAGEKLDGRSDLYSLGVVAFFAVTGRLPFEADSAGAIMAMHLTQPPPRIASLRPDLPQALAAAIDRCLEKDPTKRFESGEALAAALDPMRAARREIAPAIRLFHAGVSGGFRAFVIVFWADVYFASKMTGWDDLDALAPVVLLMAILWGIAQAFIVRARNIQRLGFDFSAVRDGLRGMLLERAEARAQELADPQIRRREALRRRLMVAFFVIGVSGIWWALRFTRTKINDHLYRITTIGVVTLFAGLGLIGAGLSLMMMSTGRASMLDRLVTAIWSGPIGRGIFRVGAWRLTRPAAGTAGAATSGSITSGPLTILASLPGTSRRELAGAKAKIELLEDALRALGERQVQLENAIAEAGTATPAVDPVVQARRTELVLDLTRARDDAIAKRERLASALENVRLQLIRVKSGVGSPSDVATELTAAQGIVAA
jgi:serine/threonine-protein kinase